MPAFVRVDDELPKLASMKLDKTRLRREAWTVADVVWRPIEERRGCGRSTTTTDGSSSRCCVDRPSRLSAVITTREPADGVDDLTPLWLSRALGRDVMSVVAERIGTGQTGVAYRSDVRRRRRHGNARRQARLRRSPGPPAGQGRLSGGVRLLRRHRRHGRCPHAARAGTRRSPPTRSPSPCCSRTSPRGCRACRRTAARPPRPRAPSTTWPHSMRRGGTTSRCSTWRTSGGRAWRWRSSSGRSWSGRPRPSSNASAPNSTRPTSPPSAPRRRR